MVEFTGNSHAILLRWLPRGDSSEYDLQPYCDRPDVSMIPPAVLSSLQPVARRKRQRNLMAHLTMAAGAPKGEFPARSVHRNDQTKPSVAMALRAILLRQWESKHVDGTQRVFRQAVLMQLGSFGHRIFIDFPLGNATCRPK